MNPIVLARLLGWFSVAMGAVEVAAPRSVARNLGLPGGAPVVRGFGLRELAAAATIFGKPWSPLGPWCRVAGDVMDLATIGAALGPGNTRRRAAAVAMVVTAGVTAADLLCATALSQRNRRALQTARRSRVATDEP